MARAVRTQAIVLLVSASVTALLLLWFVARPARLATVRLVPVSMEGLRYLSSATTARSSSGVVRCEFFGFARDSLDASVRLEVNPEQEDAWYEQAPPQLEGQLIVLRFQLGSQRWHLGSSQHYSFRLMEHNDRLLAEGAVEVAQQRIMGTDNWLILAIGLLASVLQVAEAVMRLRGPNDPGGK